MTDPIRSATASGRELVAFRIGDQEFAIDITHVREIRGWAPETALPHAPRYVRGVINLRGAVLPILDLGLRLGLRSAEPSVRHVIIVVQVGPRILGLLVDAVSDIQIAEEPQIHPTPEIGDEASREFVRGVLVVEGRMILVLGLEGVLPDAPQGGLAA